MSTATSYRKPFAPSYAAPAGETIADLLEEEEMTQTDLAQRLGVSLKHINQVINGGASISAELGLGLEKVFGVPASFWLNRDAIYRAQIAREAEGHGLKRALGWAKKFPIQELKQRGFIPSDATGDALVTSLLGFLGVAGPEQWSEPDVAYRKSFKTQSDRYALGAWLRLGELEARQIECRPFDHDAFRDALDQVRALTREEVETWQTDLVDVCAQAGVAVVIVEHFKQARAQGATWWLSPAKAVIQLSLRYRWEDIFWFSFFHEAAHVLLHRKKDLFIEPVRRPSRASAEPELLRLEDEADRFASRTLIPPRYQRQLRTITLSDVPEFAMKAGVGPGIVVGRMQHDELLPYNRGNGHRRRLQFVHEQ